MYSSFYLTVMTGAGKRHAIAQAEPEVFFPPLSSLKYIGPELHNETQRFSLLNKENGSNSEPLSIYVISTLGPKSVLEAHQYLTLNTLSLFPAKIFVTEKEKQ